MAAPAQSPINQPTHKEHKMGLTYGVDTSETLMDQLSALTNLVGAITDKANLANIIASIRQEKADLKKQYDDLQTLKAQDEATTKTLTAAKADNDLSISNAQNERSMADQARASADTQIAKAQAAQKALTQAQSDFDAKTASTNDALAKREQAVSDRETTAIDTQAKADAMKADYEAKLAAFSKLAGG